MTRSSLRTRFSLLSSCITNDGGVGVVMEILIEYRRALQSQILLCVIKLASARPARPAAVWSAAKPRTILAVITPSSIIHNSHATDLLLPSLTVIRNDRKTLSLDWTESSLYA